MKTYGNASSVSHWINLGMVIIAWANAMMVAILPRFAWMNPETSGQIAIVSLIGIPHCPIEDL